MARVTRWVRAWFCLLFGLGLLCWSGWASACKCGFIDRRELAQRYTVFVGTAVEYLERNGDGGGPTHAGPRVNAATRFEVHYSRDLPVGSSFTVASDQYTSCSTFFAVGKRHMVVSYKIGDLPFVNECPMLSDEVESAVLADLGVPAGFLPKRSFVKPVTAGNCQHPRTLDEAFRAADAVGWWDAKASCIVAGSDMVEHAAVMRWGWKGLRKGDPLRVRVAARPAKPPPPSFEYALNDATRMDWPPADLLRRDGDTLIDDGCLSPMAPASLESGQEAIARLFPLPADYRSNPFPQTLPPLPALSCATLDPSYFDDADAKIARYAQTIEGESGRERYRSGSTPPRDGSCAACTVATPTRRESFAWLTVALALLARRRRS